MLLSFRLAGLILGLVLVIGCAEPSASERAAEPMTIGTIERLDPRLDALVPSGAAIERLAGGFDWAEGPVWAPDEGALLFSDVPQNTIYRWHPADGLGIFLRPSGYGGPDPHGRELGTNGLTLDAEGRLVMADHGNRQISRLDAATYTKEPLAQRYDGRRFNSPNDLAYRSDGSLYFTDPPYGLDGLNDSPHKELPFNGVYRLAPDGTVTLLTDALTFPNGLAFSPDEQTLYVANSDPEQPIWMAYAVQPGGTLDDGRVFFDASALVAAGEPGLPDGLKVDRDGHLFATGPGGVLVLHPDGTHLGTIKPGLATANVGFGGDGSTLYLTADSLLARIPLATRGAGW